jgi:hypothetical protein
MSKRDSYRIRNWRQYSQSLVNRGSITFWFSDETIAKWYSSKRTEKPGRPDVYSEDTIRCALIIKVFGEGEWKVRKHGYSKRRTWRKVHVGICADSGQVIVSAVTSNDVSDDTAMLHMMDALDGVSLCNVLGDGAYDTIDCREAIHDKGWRQIIPPKRTARMQRKDPIPSLLPRDEAINRINELGAEGRAQWKKEIGYHRRSLAETFMFRYKTIVGDRLSARRWQTQITEVKIKLDAINRMTELGMPESYKRAI